VISSIIYIVLLRQLILWSALFGLLSEVTIIHVDCLLLLTTNCLFLVISGGSKMSP